MNSVIQNIVNIRKYLIEMCEPLSVVQLNTIPNGFNNNIVWNFGHLIAAQQGLCYIRSGLKPVVDESIILQFKGGSKPEKQWDEQEIVRIKQTMIDSLHQLNADIAEQLFSQYETFQTRYGVTLSSISDAIQFLPFHEGLHTGTIMAIKKLVSL
ncbi:MAG: DinB family protein [Sphingobacteriales bacterium]|uniref:DinB family protein n=1 Tax=Hydrotalea flava TaxID=714549 RepID=UPI00083523BC|nr:DinB family protein [Hydrotalea flava]RTL50503.1 MAG: DinB family protein [Sphingobacteriales bacterium]